MIDTIKLRSPFLSEGVALAVESFLLRRSAVRLSTGELVYEVTSDTLVGSYDHRIAVRVWRESYVKLSGGADPTRPGASALSCSEPYLVIEASVHKAMLGHNVTGGPESFRPAARWFVAHVARLCGVVLPDADGWAVMRVDWAEAFRLVPAACSEYVGSLNAASYPRRRVLRYADETILAPGATTAVKVYHKGPEFRKHDRLRCSLQFGPSLGHELQALADGTIRVETSIKVRKLRADHEGRDVLVGSLTDDYLRWVHDLEVMRLLREGEVGMQTVRTSVEVDRRLHELYGSALAGTLYACWVRFGTLGEKQARLSMARPTFYRYRKQLVDAGCSWSGTDIVLRMSAIPAGFSVVRSDSRLSSAEAPEVTAMLRPYREAV